jgi:hypothetical protein
VCVCVLGWMTSPDYLMPLISFSLVINWLICFVVSSMHIIF